MKSEVIKVYVREDGTICVEDSMMKDPRGFIDSYKAASEVEKRIFYLLTHFEVSK